MQLVLKHYIANFDDTDIIFGPIFKEQAEVIHEKEKKNNLIMLTYSMIWI